MVDIGVGSLTQKRVSYILTIYQKRNIISNKKRGSPMFDLEYYKLLSGEKPVEIFLNSLDIKMRVKAFGSLEILSEYGNALRAPYSKAVGNGLFELRIKFAGDIIRIFYFFYMDNIIVLTNGFVKKTQKTPKREMELALKYKADYEKRKQNERL
jgi:phage-related protein